MFADLVQQFSVLSMHFIQTFGYFGVFLTSFIGSASILFPLPSFLIIFSSGVFLSPFLVAIAAGLGSALGELTGYGIGYGSHKIAKKYREQLASAEQWFQRHKGFWIILIFAASPLPDDIVGIAAGAMKYPVKKFFLASLIGKMLLSLFLAYSGFFGVNWALQYFSL